MKQYFKTVLTFAILVILIFGLYFFSDWFSKATGYASGESERFNLAVCLNRNGAVFYRSANCFDCDKQLDLFGDEASKLLEINSCQTAEECPPGGVPAWGIGKQIYYGVKSLDELSALANCG